MNDSHFSLAKRKLVVFLHTIFSRFLLLLVAILYTIPFILFHCIPQKVLHELKLFHWLVAQFYRLITQCSLLEIQYWGLEHLKGIDPAIVVVNHQSSMDIPIVGYALRGRPHAWMATVFLKRSLLYRVILPRFVLWVDASSPVRGMRSLIQAMRHIESTGEDLVIFPEGRRYVDEDIHDFYNGFAVLADKLKRPVVPILLKGLHRVYPPDAFWICAFPVTVQVGKPMNVRENETVAAFTQRVRQWFLDTNK